MVTPSIGVESIVLQSVFQDVADAAGAVAAVVKVAVGNERAAMVERILSARGEGVPALIRTAMSQSVYYKKLAQAFSTARASLRELEPEFQELLASESMTLDALSKSWKRLPAFRDGLPQGVHFGFIDYSHKVFNSSAGGVALEAESETPSLRSMPKHIRRGICFQ
eukprot:6455841-Amphidinium_carterae.1